MYLCTDVSYAVQHYTWTLTYTHMDTYSTPTNTWSPYKCTLINSYVKYGRTTCLLLALSFNLYIRRPLHRHGHSPHCPSFRPPPSQNREKHVFKLTKVAPSRPTMRLVRMSQPFMHIAPDHIRASIYI